MEAFVLNRGKFAKAIFVTFLALIFLFLVTYFAGQIYNLIKIKNAFENSFSQVVQIWQKPVWDLPLPELNKSSVYSFTMGKGDENGLTALYNPKESDFLGGISFVNSKGEAASLYEIVSFFSGTKDASVNPSEITKENYANPVSAKAGYVDSDGEDIWAKELIKSIANLLISDFSVPEINKKKLGYNLLLLLSAMDIKPGQSVVVSNDGEISNAVKYSFFVSKESLLEFTQRVTSDASFGKSELICELKSIFLLFMEKCDNGTFCFNIILENEKIHSVECITPLIRGSSYMLCAGRKKDFSSVFLKAENVSQNKRLFEIKAEKDGQEIEAMLTSTSGQMSLLINANKSRVNLTLNAGKKIRVNMQITDDKDGHKIDFYPDSYFDKSPFLSIFMEKEDG